MSVQGDALFDSHPFETLDSAIAHIRERHASTMHDKHIRIAVVPYAYHVRHLVRHPPQLTAAPYLRSERVWVVLYLTTERTLFSFGVVSVFTLRLQHPPNATKWNVSPWWSTPLHTSLQPVCFAAYKSVSVLDQYEPARDDAALRASVNARIRLFRLLFLQDDPLFRGNEWRLLTTDISFLHIGEHSKLIDTTFYALCAYWMPRLYGSGLQRDTLLRTKWRAFEVKLLRWRILQRNELSFHVAPPPADPTQRLEHLQSAVSESILQQFFVEREAQWRHASHKLLGPDGGRTIVHHFVDDLFAPLLTRFAEHAGHIQARQEAWRPRPVPATIQPRHCHDCRETAPACMSPALAKLTTTDIEDVVAGLQSHGPAVHAYLCGLGVSSSERVAGFVPPPLWYDAFAYQSLDGHTVTHDDLVRRWSASAVEPLKCSSPLVRDLCPFNTPFTHEEKSMPEEARKKRGLAYWKQQHKHCIRHMANQYSALRTKMRAMGLPITQYHPFILSLTEYSLRLTYGALPAPKEPREPKPKAKRKPRARGARPPPKARRRDPATDEDDEEGDDCQYSYGESDEGEAPPPDSNDEDEPTDEDLYALCGVPRTATHDEAKKLFHKFKLDNHPDKCKDPAQKAAATARWNQVYDKFRDLLDRLAR